MNESTIHRTDWPHVLGLELAPYTQGDAVEHIERLIEQRQPAFFITANLHYAKLSHADDRIRKINGEAEFLLADGMPLVWLSRLSRRRLPGRVTGADLVPRLCQVAEQRGYRVALFGALPEILEKAAATLQERHPNLQIVDAYSPDADELAEEGDDRIVARLRLAQPDLLFVALGQPKGERWISRIYQRLGPTVSVQIGASLDFLAGKVQRAPKWMQRTGLEWTYRIWTEPSRLGPRYFNDLLFLSRQAVSTVFRRRR
jgi:N-acetylglucosaminyldiphosphoundecaprenol N-acetyl-beta-D-mannosaminyltransferase